MEHGAWGGGWDYFDLEEALEVQGHKVYRVSLTGQGERSHLLNAGINLDTHISDVINLISFEKLERVLLVGHSYGGMVISGVADRAKSKLAHLLYVDAFLPKNGESAMGYYSEGERKLLFGLAKEKGGGYSIPPFWPGWEQTRDVPHPLGTFTQKISLENPVANGVAATYVHTLEKDESEDKFSQFSARAKYKGWPLIVWQTGHNPQRTMLKEYAELVNGIASKIKQAYEKDINNH